jgi:hypothetical protein
MQSFGRGVGCGDVCYYRRLAFRAPDKKLISFWQDSQARLIRHGRIRLAERLSRKECLDTKKAIMFAEGFWTRASTYVLSAGHDLSPPDDFVFPD